MLTVLDLRHDAPDARARWRELCERSFGLDGEVDVAARAIVEQVRREGDAAVIELTERFEQRRLTPSEFELSRDQLESAHQTLSSELRDALEHAAARVRSFHELQAEALRTTGHHTPTER